MSSSLYVRENLCAVGRELGCGTAGLRLVARGRSGCIDPLAVGGRDDEPIAQLAIADLERRVAAVTLDQQLHCPPARTSAGAHWPRRPRAGMMRSSPDSTSRTWMTPCVPGSAPPARVCQTGPVRREMRVVDGVWNDALDRVLARSIRVDQVVHRRPVVAILSEQDLIVARPPGRARWLPAEIELGRGATSPGQRSTSFRTRRRSSGRGSGLQCQTIRTTPTCPGTIMPLIRTVGVGEPQQTRLGGS